MHNVWLIAKREYLERVRTRSFLIMTILIPLLMAGLVGGAALVNGRSSGPSHIAIVTQDTQFGADLKSELQSGEHSAMVVDIIPPAGAATRDSLDSNIKARQLDGYLWVTPPQPGQARAGFEWTSKSKADIVTKDRIGRAIRTVLTRESLGRSGMKPAEVDALLQPIDLDSTQAGKSDGSTAAFAGAYGMFFLMYFVILFYGMNVARSIIEEKTSRVFEVLLATISPEEMMAGKIIGVGSVGLTQVGIWIVAGLALTSFGLLGSGFSFPFTAMQVVFFVIYFLLGFILYSSVAAALGAMTSSEQELQQMNLFLMLPLIACATVIFRIVVDSDGLLAKCFSFFPFCTPLIMYTRIVVHQPPAWQIAISIAELLITIYAVLWIASRIYRVGILMYGKKPNLPEILRWLKYS
jgi:ABC-2 type transport system permease protein